MAHLDSVAESCGYAGYVEKHVTFPPKGLLPLPGKSVEADPGCDVWDEIFEAALAVNPAFNIYRIFDTVCLLSHQSPCGDADVRIASGQSCGMSLASRERY